MLFTPRRSVIRAIPFDRITRRNYALIEQVCRVEPAFCRFFYKHALSAVKNNARFFDDDFTIFKPAEDDPFTLCRFGQDRSHG